MIISVSLLNTFDSKRHFFVADGTASKNWVKPKTKPPQSNSIELNLPKTVKRLY